MLTLWLATALAIPAGGLRVDGAVPGVQLGLRDVWVTREQGPDGVHQTTLDVQVPVSIGRVPLVGEASVPLVHHWRHGEQDVGLGQVRVAARLWTDLRSSTGSIGASSWGIELAIPTRLSAPEGAWGLHAAEALPALEATYVIQVGFRTLKGMHVHLRGGVGLIVRQRTERVRIWPPAPMLDAAIAIVHPIRATPFGVGNELELITDRTPLATRHFFRTDYGGGFAVDLGVQVPWIESFAGPRSLQVIGQLRWRPTHAD